MLHDRELEGMDAGKIETVHYVLFTRAPPSPEYKDDGPVFASPTRRVHKSTLTDTKWKISMLTISRAKIMRAHIPMFV
jgi:hypothetical protein